MVKKSINFGKKELEDAFDGIITQDIKSGFYFGTHDLSVTDYFKDVKLEEFGNWNSKCL